MIAKVDKSKPLRSTLSTATTDTIVHTILTNSRIMDDSNDSLLSRPIV